MIIFKGKIMQIVIVTGMSGAGKSTALKFLEDLGYFCVDNLPPALIPKFIEICMHTGSEVNKIGLGIDIRGGRLFEDFFTEISSIKEMNCKVLFLDASDETLLTRYKETRRNHPLSKGERVIVGIEKERELVAKVKESADFIIDTSYILTRQLKEKITEIFIDNKEFDSLMITILSFGFKYGIPADADLVFDVRFIPNPYYISGLKELTGNNQEVSEYVLSWDVCKEFLKKMIDMLEFLIPNYVKEGKNQLVVAIGCTGGRHRSVTLANELFSSLQKNGNSVIIDHRDIKN